MRIHFGWLWLSRFIWGFRDDDEGTNSAFLSGKGYPFFTMQTEPKQTGSPLGPFEVWREVKIHPIMALVLPLSGDSF